MSLSRRVVVSGSVALFIGLALISVVMLSGIPPVRLTSQSTSLSTQGGNTATTTGPASETISGGSTTTTSQGQGAEGQGVLSVLLTDPPRTPPGVTAVYLYYFGLAVHGPQGWTTVKEAGGVELMGTVNEAMTLSSAGIPAGVYNSIKFEVTSAKVTYGGVNYTAIVQGGQLTVRIIGGAVVSASQPAAALIDIQPTVVNVGTQSSPQFVLWAEAKAFQVPSEQVTHEVGVEGHRFSLGGMGWWDQDNRMANASIQISGASLSSSSLTLTVGSMGSSGTFLKLIVVSTSSFNPMAEGEHSVPTSIVGSAVFVVLQNGTLVQFLPLLHVSIPMVRGESQASVFDTLLLAGYNLTAGASAHLSYSGSIELSFGLLEQPQGISSGVTYQITVIGDNAVATTTVTAA